MSVTLRILVVDDEAIGRDFLGDALSLLGHEVVLADSGDAALHVLEAASAFDLVFTDLRMPGATDGLGVLRAVKRRDPDLPVVLVTAHGTLSVATEVLRGGADDILEKPVALEDLELCLVRVQERARLLRENRFHRSRSTFAPDLLVHSEAMHEVLATVERVAASRATVLLQGESGTGKERIAAEIHRRSDRADGPLVKVNTAAVPEGLMESEFFGHEAGAFTGAVRRRQGCFEGADGGTLFLDEVGEMAPALQAKLLRVVQEGELVRVGGSRPVKVDVRLVVATNRDLEREVREGRFREDLYYRLAVVPITLPPLRSRPEDVVPLAESFLRAGLEFDAQARDLLRHHDWPGNVRELQNVVQRASLLAEGSVVDGELLGRWVGGASPDRGLGGDPIHSLVGTPLRAVEDALIEATLADCEGNRTRAAKVLGIGVRTLFNRLRAIEEREAESVGPVRS